MLKKKIPPPPQRPDDGADALAGFPKIYRDFFDHSPTAAAILEKDGTLSLVNSRFEELSGYIRGEIEGKKSWLEFVSPDDSEKLTNYHRELVKPDGWAPATYTCGFVDRNKKALAVTLNVRKIPGTSQIIVSITDSTLQKRLEDLLRAHEERYRLMVDTISLGIFKNRLESPGKFLWANPALVTMFGYESLAEFLKRPVADSYANPHDRERFIEELEKTGQVKNFEVLLKKRDGTPFWGRISAHPKKAGDGTIDWIEGTVEDINSCKVRIETCEMNKQYLHEILESAITVGIFSTDTAGMITLFNRGAQRMLGYSAGEVVGKVTPVIFHLGEEITARAKALRQENVQPRDGFEILTRQALATDVEEREWTYVKKDGIQITVILTVVKMTTRKGEMQGFLFTAKEITEKKRLEEAFRSANLQMSGVIYNLPDATFAIDREGKVIAWNRAMEVITGVRAVDILGKGNYEYAVPFYGERRPMLIDLVSAPDSQIEEWGYTGIKRKSNAITAETPALDTSNMPRVLWSIAAPIFDAAGERAGAIESLADITERKREETSLQDSILRFREILNNTGTATAIIEEDDTISYINPEFERVLGYVHEEIEGKKKWMEFVAPEDIERMQDYRRKRKIDPLGIPARYEFHFIRWDGEVRNGFLTITRIPDTGKTVAALFDITDKAIAEEAARRAKKKLNFFNSITRHDILNQLTVLKGNLELTREQTVDPDQLTVLKKEIDAADAIQSLITFTRDYQDIGLVPPEWQELKTVIINSCTGIRLGEITLIVETDRVVIFADPLLEKVFFHLIKNALDHGERTTRIRFFCEESFEELHVICEDDGIGVPPEAKKKIFNRQFFKETGLDMYLAREILSITGISISETGTYGNGARFEIHVPKGAYRFTSPALPGSDD